MVIECQSPTTEAVMRTGNNYSGARWAYSSPVTTMARTLRTLNSTDGVYVGAASNGRVIARREGTDDRAGVAWVIRFDDQGRYVEAWRTDVDGSVLGGRVTLREVVRSLMP